MNAKKESRPAGTGTAIVQEIFGRYPQKNYITAQKKKQVLFTIILAICLILSAIWVVADTMTAPKLVPVEHKVGYGDTLWSIAQEYKPDDMTMDSYMAWVYEHNDGGIIYPGDTVIMAEIVK